MAVALTEPRKSRLRAEKPQSSQSKIVLERLSEQLHAPVVRFESGLAKKTVQHLVGPDQSHIACIVTHGLGPALVQRLKLCEKDGTTAVRLAKNTSSQYPQQRR